GFFADQRLKEIDVTTGVVQTICDAPSGRGASWSAQGIIVFAPSVGGPLHAVEEHGGSSRPVTPPDSEGRHRCPCFLPARRHFLYSQDWGTVSASRPNGVYIGSLDGGEARLLLPDIPGNAFYSAGHLVYGRGGDLVAQPFDDGRLALAGPPRIILRGEIRRDDAFSQLNAQVSAGGGVVLQSTLEPASELVWLDRTGAEVGRVQPAGGWDPRLSPDGRRLAVTTDEDRDGRDFIRVVDLDRDVSTRVTSEGEESYPVWSPDGKQLAFRSGLGPRYRIGLVAADGSTDVRQLIAGMKMLPNYFSADGRALLYMRLPGAGPQLAVLEVGSDASRDLGSGAEAQFSPDGKWIAFNATQQIFVAPYPGPGERVALSRDGGAQPRWSGDGKRIFYIDNDRRLMEVTVATDGARLVPSAPRALFRTRIVSPTFVLWQYDVDAAGNRFIVNSVKPDVPMSVVTNWPA